MTIEKQNREKKLSNIEKKQILALKEVLEIAKQIDELLNATNTTSDESKLELIKSERPKLNTSYEKVDLWGRLLSFEQILKDLEQDSYPHKIEAAFINAKEVLLASYCNHLISLTKEGKEQKEISAKRIIKSLKKLEDLYPQTGIDQYFDTLDL